MRRLVLALVAAVALLGGLGTVPASAATGWTAQSAANEHVQQGVSCWSSTGCLSVGPAGALKLSSGKWVAVSGTPAGLVSVSCPSSTYCVAVGETGGHKASAYKWNGSTWTWMTPYNTGSAVNQLLGVRCASASSCEAVGDHSGSSFEYPLAEAWNGSKWADQSTSGAPQGYLAGVACESSGKCEAVGEQPLPSTFCGGSPNYYPENEALAMGLSGSKWVTQATPAYNCSDNAEGTINWHDNAISCWSSGCVAVGGILEGGGPSSSGDLQYAQLWNGTKWSEMGKNEGITLGYSSEDGGDWNGVYCTSASSCTAAGDWYYDEGYYETLVNAWNGSAWTQVPSASPDVNPSSGTGIYGEDALNGLACASGTCYAAGQGNPNNNYPQPGDNTVMEKS
ncbi:MAG: hypothetical protein ACLQDY_24995 [Streptosporangiaceae bacterium]